MKKELTREEVEKVLDKYSRCVLADYKIKEIINDLFGKPFEVGDWVVGWHSDGDMVNHLNHCAWQINQVRSNGTVLAKDEAGYSTSVEHIRHATQEEIAEATWEEGKTYRVRNSVDSEEWIVRISSKEVGHFYHLGKFQGSTYSWNQYEKL